MPPKAKRLKSSSSSEYLFVNADANTVLSPTRDAEVDRSKQRHVQRRQFAKRRGETANQAMAVPALSSPVLDFGSETHATELGGLTINSPPPDEELSSSDYVDLFKSSTLGDHLLKGPFESGLHGDSLLDRRSSQSLTGASHTASHLFATRKQPALTLSPPIQSDSRMYHNARDEKTAIRRISQGLASNVVSFSPVRPNDAFSNTFLALQKWAPPLIQYYTTVIVPSLFAIELRTVPMQLMRHTPALHADMRQCMSEAAPMYALLAATSAMMLRDEGRLLLPNIRPEDYARVPLFFKTKAMASLRQKLEKGHIDSLLALDIFRLTIAAIKMDDQPAADAHFQAMIEIVRGLGGLEALDSYLKERLILNDIWRAANTLSKPKFHLSWDPGHLPQELREEISSEEHESGLGSSFDHEDIVGSDDFLKLIEELIEVVDIVRYSHAHPLAAINFQWLLLRRTAIEHKLLSRLASQQDKESMTVELARLGTLIWIEMVLAYRNARNLSAQVSNLKTKLEAGNVKEYEASYTELLLWISATAAIASADEATKSWFTDMARVTASKLQIESIEDMEGHLHRFLYVPELQRDSLDLFTDELLANSRGKGKGVAIKHR